MAVSVNKKVVGGNDPQILTSLPDRPTAAAFGKGDLLIVNPNYLIKCTSDNVTWDSHGSSDLIADMPSAAALGKGSWQVGEAIYVSDGIRWVNAAGTKFSSASRYMVASLATANAATYTQSDTLITVTSTGHNIPATTYDGVMIYLPIASGLATAGWFSGFTRTGPDEFTCVSSLSLTTSGTVNTNTSVTLLPGHTVQGGLLGDNGAIRYSALHTNNNSAGAKNTRLNIAGTGVPSFGPSSTTAISSYFSNGIIVNTNSKLKQLTSLGTATAIDTSVDINVATSISIVAANDFCCIEFYSIEIIR